MTRRLITRSKKNNKSLRGGYIRSNTKDPYIKKNKKSKKSKPNKNKKSRVSKKQRGGFIRSKTIHPKLSNK